MAILDATHVGTVTEVIVVAKDPVCGMDVDERKASGPGGHANVHVQGG
jgi:hypothetical protein